MMVTPGPKVKRNQTIERVQGVYNAVSKRLYTLKEAAEYLGRSEWSMRELIWAGRIPVVRREGGRKIFLDVEDLNNFINENKSICL
jgi:excisionase family DNA binding protein